MSRTTNRLPWLLALAPLLLLATGRAEDPPRPAPPLVVLAAGESLGHLEPCHCVAGMHGGFPRRLAAIERARKEGRVLALDGGDLSAGEVHHPALLEAKTRAALELCARAGIAAVAVGELDLRRGWEPLLRQGRLAGVTLLLANGRRADGVEARPFPASRTVDLAGGRTALVVGALDPELPDPTGQLALDPPDAPVRAALEAAPEGALRVVLFHGTREAALRLFGADLPADVIVCGHGRTEAPRPLEKHGRALVVETVRDARLLAKLALPPSGEPVLEQLALSGDVPDDPWARERVDAYYKEVKELPEPPRKPVPEGGSFVGAEACKACHEEAWKVFANTLHRGAQARIEARDPVRGGLAECTPCHVTGHGYTGGFESLANTPHLAEVGCESCHGVGEAHVSAPLDKKRGYGVKAGFPGSWKATCVTCHDPTNSPKFEFESWLAKIRHWRDR